MAATSHVEARRTPSEGDDLKAGAYGGLVRGLQEITSTDEKRPESRLIMAGKRTLAPDRTPQGALREQHERVPAGKQDHGAGWARMDELAERVTVAWPRGVSAADAVSEARRTL